MPTNIDQEVLQMKLDNSQFKKGITDTLNALKDFKNKITFKESIKSVEQLSSATKNFSADLMANSVQTISNRFTNLGIIGMTALQNIANQAINTGTRLISSLTIDPVKMGFNEYEQKMGSIQTIMAATGESLESVNGYLEELNAYSDKTIYSFSDMTANIGKFTNAGVKLEDAVMAIKGISNEAAVSGANANEASRAMYNFAQALSSGSVRLADWKSIELANMGTVEFKQQLLDTAVALGTVVEEEGKYRSVTTDANGKVSELFSTTTAFNDSLSSQWMTTEVLVETLKRYADETTDIGAKAYRSAQEIKTVSMLWDTWKESVQSGWGMTFQYIIGDFEEAKALLTEVNNAIGPILDAMADARNIPLGIWHDLGGRVALIDSLRNILSSIGSIIGAIEKAFTNVFNDNVGQILYDMTVNFKNFTERLIVGDETLSKIEKTFTAVFQVIRTVGGAVAWLAGKIISLSANAGLEALKFIGDFFLNIGSALADVVFYIGDFVTHIASLDSVRSIFNSLNSARKALVKGFKDLYKIISKFTLNKQIDLFNLLSKAINKVLSVITILIEAIDSAIQSFAEWVQNGETVKSITEAFTLAANALSKILDILWRTVTRVADVISSNFGSAIKSVTSFISDTIEKVKEFVQAFLEIPEVQQFIEDIKEGAKNFGNMIVEGVTNAKNALSDFFDTVMSFDPANVIDSIRQLKTNIQEAGVTAQTKASSGIETFVTDVKDSFSQAVQTGSDAVGFFTKKYKTLSDFIGSLVEKIDAGTIAAAGITGGMTYLIFNLGTTVQKVGNELTNFLKIGSSITGIFGSISTVITNIGNAVNNFSTQFGEILKARALAVKMEAIGTLLLKIAGAVGILALSIGALTLLDQEKLRSAATTLGLFAGGLIALVGVLGILDRVFKAGDLEKYATLLIALSVSLAIITGALFALGEVNSDGLWEKVAVIGVLIGILAGVVIAIQKFSKTVGPAQASVAMSAGSILAIAGSLLIMVGAVKLISDTDAGSLVGAVAVIGVLGLILTGIAYLASKIPPGADLALIAVAAALGLMALVIKQYSTISYDTLKASLPSLITVIGMFAVLMAASARAGQYALRGGVGLLAMSGAIILMGFAIKQLAGISKDELSKASESIFGISLLFAALIAVMSKAGPNSAKAGAGILAISASIMIIAGAIMILSQISKEDLQNATGAVVALEAMFALIIASTKNAKGIEKTLIPMIGAIAALAASVIVLSLIDPNRLFSATAAMSALMVSLSLLVASTGKSKSAYGQLAFMMVIVGALAGIIFLLNGLNPESAIGSATAIGLLLLTMTVSLSYMDGVKDIGKGAIVGMAVLTLVVAALAGILYLLRDLNPDSAIPIASSLTMLLLGMTACCTVMTSLGVQAAPAAQAALALVAFVGILGVFMGAVGALVTYIPQIQEFLNAGIPVLQAIGEGIGSFVGGIVGGAIDAASDSLPAVGENLSSFATNIQPFISSMSSIPDNLGDKVGSIVSAIAAISASNFLNSLSNFGNVGMLFGGDSSLVTFGKDLEEFASCMISVSNKFSEVQIEPINNILPAIDSLTTCCEKVNPNGPLSFLFGGNQFTEFGASLEGLGSGLASFGEAVSGIEQYSTSVDAAVQMVTKLGDAQSHIGESGGLLQAFTGWTGFENFASGLKALGEGVSDFATAVKDVTADALPSADTAVQIIQKLGDAQEYINPSGGLMQMLLGENSFANFGTSLSSLGEGISNFAQKVSGIGDQAEAINSAIQIIQKLGEMQGTLVAEGGLFTGTNTYSSFAGAAANLGLGVSNFASALSSVTIDIAKIDAVAQTFTKLQEISWTLDSLNTDGMVAKIDKLKEFVTKFNEIPPASEAVGVALTVVANAINSISELISSSGAGFYTSSYDSANKIGEGFIAGVNASTGGMTGSIDTLSNTLLDCINGKISSFETAAQDLSNRFADAFISNVGYNAGSMRSAINSAVSSAASAARSHYRSFSSAGSYLVSGLAAGIWNNRSAAITAASTVAAEAYAAAKRELDVRSPSKKFMYLGEMSVRGFVNGFRNNVGYVKMGAERTAEASLNAFRNAVSGYGSIQTFLETDANPMITPVVNLSNVRAAAAKIDGLFVPTRSVALSAGIMQESTKSLKSKEELDSGKRITNNYYLDGINVTQETEGNFMEEMIDLLVKYNRLAEI